MTPVAIGRKGRLAQTLKEVPVFSKCSNRDLKFVASAMEEIRVPAGQELTRQGQRNNAFYVVLEGEAKVVIDGKAVKVLGQGDFFGEISMMDFSPASATVTASKPSHMMRMSHRDFRDLVRREDNVFAAVMTVMAERLTESGLTSLYLRQFKVPKRKR